MKAQTREAGLRLAILSVLLGICLIGAGFLLRVGGLHLLVTLVLLVMFLAVSWTKPSR